ncbi:MULTISPECIES: DUF4126 domain-containing protein [unclassified Roseateles]|uniref:DUF4126 domain-containing protein n=1 Tax=unclassified Roseateles TaxID=2626991 RepID=UPI0006FD1E25|nr:MULTISPECIES: DUF4126 domain-containing protein [unclassified Roseateles]KQW51331.1 hypothetical protein ASC81_01380 [Pelomonas sp. Root405]KRA77563.1 hypothetical protein ASD88_01380 [Pelomonas sp. Root662]
MPQLDALQLIALAAALGWASGLRLYLTVLLVGMAGHWGWIALPPGLQVLASPLVMGCAAALACVEFLADKIPLVDSAWDALHTFIRIPAGAALVAGLASGWAGDQGQAWTVIAALFGGGLAAAAHTAKASTRAAANTSPEPFSNIGLSLAGDVAVPTMLWLAWAHPFIFFPLLVTALAVMAVLTWFCFKFVRALVRRVRRPASA